MDTVIKSLSHTASTDSTTGPAAGTGVYEVQYRVDIAGQYMVRVQYGGQQVTGSPFSVVVKPVGIAANVTIIS